jgi:hypothetical protein
MTRGCPPSRTCDDGLRRDELRSARDRLAGDRAFELGDVDLLHATMRRSRA